jgi:Spherulation-specific family 4
VLVLLASIVVLAAAAVATVGMLPGPGPGPGRSCQAAFLPAFFSPGGWTQAVSTRPVPRTMILDITTSGAGRAPEPAFQTAVKKAQAAGVTVLGYANTSFGARPAAAVEQDVKNYKAWYGVTSILLDQAAADAGKLGYYRRLAGFIRSADPGGAVWLNPGIYPDQRYMAIASVVMAFEGPYSSYSRLRVPAWVGRYPAAKFAHTIYATPGSRLASAISLARSRHAGWVFVTDRSGANPYDGLPSFWSREQAAIAQGCHG